MENKRPIIGISMGDPFGNGPEITATTLSDPAIYEACAPLVVGDLSSMQYALSVMEKLTGKHLELNVITVPREGKFEYGSIDLIDLGKMDPSDIPHNEKDGVPQPFGLGATKIGGEAAFQYVVKVIDLAMKMRLMRLLRTPSVKKPSIWQGTITLVIRKSMRSTPIRKNTP